MPERFTETLRTTSELGWSHAVQHRFVNELFAGAVPDAVMARYLIQDHRFLDSFAAVFKTAVRSPHDGLTASRPGTRSLKPSPSSAESGANHGAAPVRAGLATAGTATGSTCP